MIHYSISELMAERSILDRILGREKEDKYFAAAVPSNQSFKAVAGIPDIVRDTEKLNKDSNYDNEFDMYDQKQLNLE